MAIFHVAGRGSASLEFHIELASGTPVLKKNRGVQALPRSWAVDAGQLTEDRISELGRTVWSQTPAVRGDHRDSGH